MANKKKKGMKMKKPAKHWIIPDAWGTGYMSICGMFRVSIFHQYGISHITEKIVNSGALTPKEITCKHCKKAIKLQKNEDIICNKFMITSFYKHGGKNEIH